MPGLTRLGVDASSGGCGRPPTVAVGASSNVFVNKIPSVRTGDPYAVHAKPPSKPPHGPSAVGLANKVFVNGRIVHRMGDPLSCGDSGAAGSPNVFSG